MFKTKNDLPEATRVKAVELLNARLADCIDLQTQTKQAHWNVKGPNFIALHELFDKINEEVEDYVDDIAERAVQLGGVAEGTARMVAKRSSRAEYLPQPAGVADQGVGHVRLHLVDQLPPFLWARTARARRVAGEVHLLLGGLRWWCWLSQSRPARVNALARATGTVSLAWPGCAVRCP